MKAITKFAFFVIVMNLSAFAAKPEPTVMFRLTHKMDDKVVQTVEFITERTDIINSDNAVVKVDKKKFKASYPFVWDMSEFQVLTYDKYRGEIVQIAPDPIMCRRGGPARGYYLEVRTKDGLKPIYSEEGNCLFRDLMSPLDEGMKISAKILLHKLKTLMVLHSSFTQY